MKFVSTRSESEERKYSFEEALLAGWAENGGMLLPETIPRISKHILEMEWSAYSYPELCFRVLKEFIGEDEIPREDLKQICEVNSFTSFSVKEVVKVHALENSSDDIRICELFHGPTLAFKDLGLQVLARLLEYVLKKRKQRLNLLVGTSGDTGSSAMESVRHSEVISIVCLYPLGRTSKVQELQMTSIKADNVHLIGCEGTSDDLDKPIEEIFRDVEFKVKQRIGSVNSVNIARVLVQIVHYFFAYFQCECKDIGFFVPTGAGGHLTAGIIAMKMGLPIQGGIHVATNSNDIMHQFLSKGKAEVAKEVIPTNSPAMDIQIPYNIERILYYATDGDQSFVTKAMADFKTHGSVSIPEQVLGKIKYCWKIRSSTSSTAQVLSCIDMVWKQSKYLLDPHTAVGVAAALSADRSENNGVRMCMGCAHPAKFVETVAEALNLDESDVEDLCASTHPNHKNIQRVLDLRKTATASGYVLFAKDTDWNRQLREIISKLPT